MSELKEIINKKSVGLQVEAVNWKEAVQAAGQLLVAQEVCKIGYIEAMAEAIQLYGPYMVIAPGIALIHSRPSEMVFKSGISLINLLNPVNFGDASNDPVLLVIAFAAVDDGSHIRLLQQLAVVLMDEKKLEILKKAKEVKEVLAVFIDLDIE